jgi:hypothetical protein
MEQEPSRLPALKPQEPEAADEMHSTATFNDDDLEEGAVRVGRVVDCNQEDVDNELNLPLQALSCIVVIGIILATATAILGQDLDETSGGQ